MEYKRMNKIKETITYHVFEGTRLSASFSYAIKSGQFWVETLRLEPAFEDFQTMESVLQFIQYKCWAAGFSALYVRLHVKNLFAIEWYRRYGFREIAQEETTLPHGGVSLECVMRYALPGSREEHFSAYLNRKRQAAIR